MSIGPDCIQFSIGGVNCQRWEDVAEIGEQWGVVDQIGCPRLPHICTARNIDVVIGPARPFLNAWFSSGIDIVDVMSMRIRHNGSLGIIKSRVACRSALTDDRVTYFLPGI